MDVDVPALAPEPAAPIDGPRRVEVHDGIGAGGNIEGNALGPHSQVTNITEQHIHEPPRVEVLWPVELGPVPTLASAFQPRTALRRNLYAPRSGGGAMVRTQVLSGGGGVGKSQLAAACAAEALAEGTDLVMWAAATEVQQVITQYAQAAARIAVPGVNGQDLEADARAFLSWLATTSRRWVVVLDDITDPEALSPWWPASRTGTGWVLATTRLHDARLTGGGRTRVAIDVYTRGEAAAYLHTRLTDEGMTHLLDDHTEDLAQALGHLPLALGHAAAYMINEDLPCAAYLARFNHRQTRLEQALPPSADTEGYGRQITTTLLLSLDAARNTEPTGLAEPVLRLAAMLDPAGHPHALWTTPAAIDYLTAHRTPPTADTITEKQGAEDEQAPKVTPEQVHAALRALHRYALLTCDTRAEPRAVRVHALTARAVRETTPAPSLPGLATAAADALLHTWPDPDQPHRDLAAALRTNTDTLAGHAHDVLWHPDGHPVLYRAGSSLLNAGLTASAIAYWHHMTISSERLLGIDHPDTLTTRGNLAVSYRDAGRTAEAIEIGEQVVADRERILGNDHPDTLTARSNLATCYRDAGRRAEAIEIEEQVVADRERLLGIDHPDTLLARGNLATSYWDAGRTAEAMEIEERVVADRERLLGIDHPDTLLARGNLATSYRQLGRTAEAIEIGEQVVADRERILGNDHPDTLLARSNLASSYWDAGRTAEAIILLERVVADRERLLGIDHPSTLLARGNLATSYWDAGRRAEAMEIEERVIADRERILGNDHPDTLLARSNLATSYRQLGRTAEAIEIGEQVVADRERILGN
ncbi:tetratricopeptide repeat protein, partial [Streptomyces sp. NPDC004266]|uniref:tetratricopeptide repeat protein n=1 Tax=Streptomyces sp. NPDC004266 TaxID=3364693 RepID=UPI00367B3BB5